MKSDWKEMTSGLEAFPVPEKVAGEMFRVKGKQFSSIPNNHNSLKCVQLTLQLFQKYFNRSVPQDSLRMLHCETWRGQCCVLAHPFPFFPSTEKLHFPGSVFLFHRGLCIAAGATAPLGGYLRSSRAFASTQRQHRWVVENSLCHHCS